MLALEAKRLDPVIEAQGSDDLGSALRTALLSSGQLSAEDIGRAAAAADSTGKRLDQALVELGLLAETELLTMLREKFAIYDFRSSERSDPVAWPEQIPPRFWSTARVAPIRLSDDTIVLGMVDPFDDFVAKAIGVKLRKRVSRMRLTLTQLDDLIAEIAPETAGNVSFEQELAPVARANDVQLLREAATDAPVVRFVQSLLRTAVVSGASDIHLRPTRNGSGQVLLRISGDLVEKDRTSADMLPAIISRLKILADLDISERRRPQDGRLNANVAGTVVDVRLSTMPHVEGEGAVLRLLARDAGIASLLGLGFSEAISAGLEKLFHVPNGLILVTGPTGSGKTTTQHTALRQLVRPGVNVVTVEDPVEYRLEGASQIQIDEKVGLTFPVVLRSLLRQDPDVIFIGEIRDGDTARIAVQAALTGHLVLATLHTNSAPDAVPRLIDMGVEPYLLEAVLRGVLSQRLLRKPCPHCGIPASPGPLVTEYSNWLELGPGCDACAGNGHLGRTAVGELMIADAALTSALGRHGVSAAETQALLSSRGHISLHEDIARATNAGLVAASEAMASRHD